jgi:hypothetical protein
MEGAPSVVPARAFFFVLADEIDPLRPKLVRKAMVNPSMAAAYAERVGRAIQLQPNPARYGLHPTAPNSMLPPGRHAAGMKPSSFSSASAKPFGSNRIAGSRFWIDVAKAKEAGAEFVSTGELLADLDRIARKTANPSGVRKSSSTKTSSSRTPKC